MRRTGFDLPTPYPVYSNGALGLLEAGVGRVSQTGSERVVGELLGFLGRAAAYRAFKTRCCSASALISVASTTKRPGVTVEVSCYVRALDRVDVVTIDNPHGYDSGEISAFDEAFHGSNVSPHPPWGDAK